MMTPQDDDDTLDDVLHTAEQTNERLRLLQKDTLHYGTAKLIKDTRAALDTMIQTLFNEEKDVPACAVYWLTARLLHMLAVMDEKVTGTPQVIAFNTVIVLAQSLDRKRTPDDTVN